MNMMGYTDPLRSTERKMAPDYAQRELRDPGIRMTRPHLGMGMRPPGGGLGSLHHTMPHLRRLSAGLHFDSGGTLTPQQAAMRQAGTMSPAQAAQMEQLGFDPDDAMRAQRFQGGGLSGNPVGELAAASRPNLYNPDPQFRQFMQLINQTPLTNTSLRQAPSPAAQFVYQGGGEVDDEDQGQDQQPDMEEVESPDDQLSPAEQQEREVVLNAMAALDGQSPDPEADLKAFIDTFGARALADLQQLVEEKHQEAQGGDEDEDEDEEEDQEGGPGDGQEDQDAEEADDLQGAGGGLLHGRGTGQSDEIEGTTPSGRPVLLSDGEYVVDAPTVAALGDGSTKAGARRLDDMRKQIRHSAYGHDKQLKPMARGGTPVVLKLK